MYRLNFKAYRRRFAGAFANAREHFPTREGILLRVEDADGRVGFGEAAPISSFGTESFAAALAAVAGLGAQFVPPAQLSLLRGHPALLWGLESAVAMAASEDEAALVTEPWPVSGLAPDLEDLERIEELLQLHYRCLKFKIGRKHWVEERRLLDRALDLSEGQVAIRLDANGVLDAKTTAAWLESLAETPVEFLEQPMPVGAEREMARLGADFPTPLALDESVCSVDDLKRWRDEQWPGVFVIKPSLSGSRSALREELEIESGDCVYSSALETAVGARSALGLALAYPGKRRALGFGVDQLFADRKLGLELGPFLQSDWMPSIEVLESLWNQI